MRARAGTERIFPSDQISMSPMGLGSFWLYDFTIGGMQTGVPEYPMA
jgi:hypothetical protein